MQKSMLWCVVFYSFCYAFSVVSSGSVAAISPQTHLLLRPKQDLHGTDDGTMPLDEAEIKKRTSAIPQTHVILLILDDDENILNSIIGPKLLMALQQKGEYAIVTTAHLCRWVIAYKEATTLYNNLTKFFLDKYIFTFQVSSWKGSVGYSTDLEFSHICLLVLAAQIDWDYWDIWYHSTYKEAVIFIPKAGETYWKCDLSEDGFQKLTMADNINSSTFYKHLIDLNAKTSAALVKSYQSASNIHVLNETFTENIKSTGDASAHINHVLQKVIARAGALTHQYVIYINAHGGTSSGYVVGISDVEFVKLMEFLNKRVLMRGLFISSCYIKGKTQSFVLPYFHTSYFPIVLRGMTVTTSSIVNFLAMKKNSLGQIQVFPGFHFVLFAKYATRNEPAPYDLLIPLVFQVGDFDKVVELNEKIDKLSIAEKLKKEIMQTDLEKKLPVIRLAQKEFFGPMVSLYPYQVIDAIRTQVLSASPLKLTNPFLVGEGYSKKNYYFVLLRTATIRNILDWRENDRNKINQRVIVCVKDAGVYDYVFDKLLDSAHFWSTDTTKQQLQTVLKQLFSYFYPSNNEFYEGAIRIKEYGLDIWLWTDQKTHTLKDVYLRRTNTRDQIIVKDLPKALSDESPMIYERSRSGTDTEWHLKSASDAQEVLKTLEAKLNVGKYSIVIPPEFLKREFRFNYPGISALADLSQDLEAVYKQSTMPIS